METIPMIDIVSLYNQTLTYCLPFIIFTGLANMIVNMILTSAFSGKLRVG